MHYFSLYFPDPVQYRRSKMLSTLRYLEKPVMPFLKFMCGHGIPFDNEGSHENFIYASKHR